jgi:hypothetical protein
MTVVTDRSNDAYDGTRLKVCVVCGEPLTYPFVQWMGEQTENRRGGYPPEPENVFICADCCRHSGFAADIDRCRALTRAMRQRLLLPRALAAKHS